MIAPGGLTEGTSLPRTDSAPPRALRSDARRNQQRVIAAAREVLSEFGEDTTMELIAARAAVGVGTIYRHYANKAALLDELVRSILGELLTVARESLSRDDGFALETFLFALGRSFSDHAGYSDYLMTRASDAGTEVLRGLMGELLIRDQRHSTIDSGVTFGDLMGVVAGLRGVVRVTGPHVPEHSTSWERYLTFQLRGLRPSLAPDPALSAR